MARFHGIVGYGISQELNDTSSKFRVEVTEREYFGDVIREGQQLTSGDNINPNLHLNNRISIVADDFANDNLQAIRYVVISGAYWKVTSVEIQRPRLILSIGGPYNGPKATKSSV